MSLIAEVAQSATPAEQPPAPAMAFTIDFSTGDAKMGDKDSLSKFNPVKGRRSFRSRSAKGQRSEDADDDEKQVQLAFFLLFSIFFSHSFLIFKSFISISFLFNIVYYRG